MYKWPENFADDNASIVHHIGQEPDDQGFPNWHLFVAFPHFEPHLFKKPKILMYK